MTIQFLKYFLNYIFRAKTRQRLLFLAIVGLFLSSFALLVLQSTMGGLQNKLIGRSKSISGTGLISSATVSVDGLREIEEHFKSKKISFHREYEIELLIKNGSYIAPVILRGIDPKNPPVSFLKGIDLNYLALGSDLANYKLNSLGGDLVKVISPTHVNSLMGDIPRMITLEIDGIIQSDVPEIDLSTAWVKLAAIENLTRTRGVNRLRFYEDFDVDKEFSFLKKKFPNFVFESWEDRNKTLVWALTLENVVMVFLFVAMTLLVSLCITSGLLVFFNKIKNDLSSFWILGASEKKIENSGFILLNILSFGSVVLGLLFGLLFLFFLDRFAPEVMPDVFVDRKIPVKVTGMGLLISFGIPYLISLLFSWFGLVNFKKDHDYLDQVRSIG